MFPFENLEVYKKTFEINRDIYKLVKEKKPIPGYFKDQLGRASLSILLNIAEGSGKFSNKNRRNFFVIARGSTFECAAVMELLHAENEISKEQRDHFITRFEEISKMLYAMIKNLEKQE